MLSFSPDDRTKAARVAARGDSDQPITAEEAAERTRAHSRMVARQELIDRIIRNNEQQLRNESARGGAEIELECAKRDVARHDVGAKDELERSSQRLAALRDEHARLVAEREWLNAALLQFDSSPSDDEHKNSGHA